MHNLVIAVIIPMPMPMAFMAVLFVAVTPAIIIVIFVFVAMFIVTAPMALLGKNHTGAEREYCYGESMQPSA
jgi:hypothetical protein